MPERRKSAETCSTKTIRKLWSMRGTPSTVAVPCPVQSMEGMQTAARWRPEFDGQPTRKRDLQSYNHKEQDSANNLNEPGDSLLSRGSRQEHCLPDTWLPDLLHLHQKTQLSPRGLLTYRTAELMIMCCHRDIMPFICAKCSIHREWRGKQMGNFFLQLQWP